MRFLILLPILVAFAFLEVFIGGARLLYAIPGVALLALCSFFISNRGIKTSQRGDLLAIGSSLLFAGYILVRNRFSEIEYIARLQFFIMAGCLLIYLFFTLVLTRPVDRKHLFFFLGILALIQLIPAIIQFTQGDQWMPLSWAQRRDHSWRGTGFFISPNNFAGFMEIIALFAASYTIWGRTMLMTRILTGYTALLCIAGVAISGSRGGYLSIVFGLGVLLILSLVAWRRMQREHFLLASLLSVGAALALFGGVLLLVFMSPTLAERVMQINDPQNPRLILWPAAIQQFHLSPVWGTGGFSYLYYGRLFRNPSVQNDPIHAHNDYLQLLADYGIVGMALFVIFLVLHLRAAGFAFLKLSSFSSHTPDSQSDRLAFNIAAIAAVGAYMVHSVVDFNMQLPLNALMMAAVFAILANPGAPTEESRSTDFGERFRTALRVALPFLTLMLLIYGVPMIRGEYLAERARISLRDGHPQEALDWAREGTLKTRDNPELYFYRGEAATELAMQGGNKNEADPKVLRMEAVGAFSSGLKLFPYDSRLALKLAQAQAAAGDYFSAISSVDYAERLDPNSAFVPAYRGVIEYSYGFYEDAKIAFNQALLLGGEAAQMAQQGMALVDKEQAKENEPQEITTAGPDSQSATEENQENQKPAVAPDSGATGGDLMNALPAAKPQ